MDYIVDEKRFLGIPGKLKWIRLPANKKKSDDLQRYIGYVKISGYYNGHEIFLNKGNITTDIDF